LRVHLIGYHTPPQTMPLKNRPYVLPALIEEAPMYRAKIEVDRSINHADAWNRTTALKRRGQAVEITVQDVHEVIALRY